MIYLLDTDITIYWMKGNKTISNKVVNIGFSNVGISDLTRAELYYGAYKSKRINENLTAIKILEDKINFIPFNEPAQSLFGQIKAKLENIGKRLDDMDIMIASTAIAYNLTLITNNINHFERITE